MAVNILFGHFQCLEGNIQQLHLGLRKLHRTGNANTTTAGAYIQNTARRRLTTVQVTLPPGAKFCSIIWPMGERGISTRSSTTKGKLQNQATPVKYGAGTRCSMRATTKSRMASRSLRVKREWRHSSARFHGRCNAWVTSSRASSQGLSVPWPK